MNFESLTPEQQEKARACKTPEDMLALAKEEGFELSDDELSAISGGMTWDCLNDCSGYERCDDYECLNYCAVDYR